MSKILSCQSTAWPDGSKVLHQHGMQPLKIRDMKAVMRQAIIENLNHRPARMIQLLSLNKFKNA